MEHTTAMRIANQLQEDYSLNDAQASAMYEAMWDLARQDQAILDNAAHAERITERVRKQVANGEHMNELGELARTAIDLDRAVALREQAFTTLKRTAAALDINRGQLFADLYADNTKAGA